MSARARFERAAARVECASWSPPSGELRDLRLHVRVSGQGEPTWLLLHGLGGSHRYFGAAFDSFAEGGRLVVPDLLGFGGSRDRAGGDYGPDEHSGALIELLEQLAANAPVYIGAHSIGTLVALRLAARRPDWIRGIVAFGPPLYSTAEQAQTHLAGLGRWVRFFALNTVWARWACAWMCRNRGTAARLAQWMRPDLPVEIAHDGVAHTWHSYSGSLQQLVLAAHGLRDLERIDVPVRLIVGKQDSVVDVELLRRIAATHANVQLEEWPGGHDLPLTHAQCCADALRALA